VLRSGGWQTVLCGVTYVLNIHSFRTVNVHRVSQGVCVCVCVYIYIYSILHDLLFNLTVPTPLSLVGGPLSGNGCDSPNHI
jgi:hypothetical protein